uniref:Coronin n=1 Tax=Sexangularia sp. CB-2014 TaxID=1486929 RepID=A0A7S1VA20_9EUKA
MARFVRSSKYRHVFTPPQKTEEWFNGVRVSKTAWEGSDYVAASTSKFAMCWGTAGGGAVAVVNFSDKGKLPEGDKMPIINGHKNPVLDLAWNPFNESLLATASEDGYSKIWKIADEGLTESLTADDAVQSLKGHRRKVGTVAWHPTANNVLATSSQDYTVKLWDIEKGEAKVTLDGPKDLIHATQWNRDGSLLAITGKDKQIRFGDPRTANFEASWQGHDGVKGARVLFLNDGKIFSTGFDRQSSRQYRVWDPRGDTSKPLVSVNLDVSSGVLMPKYDYDTSILFIAGRGDGNIRFFEYTGEDKLIYPLSEHKGVPYKGGAWVPKTGCNVSENEIARFLGLCEPKNAVIPVPFIVPRKSDLFQDDIFPETADGVGEPSLTLAEYFDGKNADPKTVSLENGFVRKERPAEEPKFEKKEEEELTPAQLKAAYEKAQNRITYLEAELQKRELLLKEANISF